MRKRWSLPRGVNYRGEEIPAAAGLWFVAPAVVLCLLLAVLAADLRREALLQAASLAAFAVLGWLDDVRGTREFRGLRGHVCALLRHRRFTTGLVKLIGGTGFGLLLGWLAAPRAWEAILNGALIALGANVINLLDLRPGRALKAFAVGMCPLIGAAGWPGALPILAVAVPCAIYAPFDLRARVMMGDTGSNALGASLGMAAALYLEGVGRLVVLALLIGLQGVGEFGSISALIERWRVLRFLDRLGRREP